MSSSCEFPKIQPDCILPDLASGALAVPSASLEDIPADLISVTFTVMLNFTKRWMCLWKIPGARVSQKYFPF